MPPGTTSVSVKDKVLRRALSELSFELDPTDLAAKRMLEYPRTSQAAIKFLEGIEACTGLTLLELPDHEITDLSPLGGLVKLSILHLYGNRTLEDVTPLAGLKALEVLYLAKTNVRSLESLRGLVALKYLSVSETPITDLSPIAELPKLTTLILGGNDELVLEPGNANFATVTALIDRGVDVDIRGNASVDAYKGSRGIEPSSNDDN